MKTFLLAGAALLGVSSISGTVLAQDAMAPAGQPPAGAMTPSTDPAMPTPPANPATNMPAQPDGSSMPMPADPNAGQPTGAVPADPGMMPAPANAPRDPAAPMGSAENPVTMGGNMTPPPTDAKDYPVCSRTVQDSCINPGQARRMRKPG